MYGAEMYVRFDIDVIADCIVHEESYVRIKTSSSTNTTQNRYRFRWHAYKSL